MNCQSVIVAATKRNEGCMYCEHWTDLWYAFKGKCAVHCSETSSFSVCPGFSASQAKIEYFKQFNKDL